jgi:hypothetical protein
MTPKALPLVCSIVRLPSMTSFALEQDHTIPSKIGGAIPIELPARAAPGQRRERERQFAGGQGSPGLVVPHPTGASFQRSQPEHAYLKVVDARSGIP